MTLTVFTCAVGPTKDIVQAPLSVNPHVRYVCLTDRPRVPAPYVRVPVTAPGEDPMAAALYARELKIRVTHPSLGDPDVVLWHDASFQLACDPLALATQALAASDFVAFRHPHRDRIEDEAAVIARLGYVPADVLAGQVAAYQAEGFTQTAITSTGFSLRRLTPAVRAFNNTWWAEVARWCWRDQMSVDYALWKTGLTVTYIEGHYRDNPYAQFFLDGVQVARRRHWIRASQPWPIRHRAASETEPITHRAPRGPRVAPRPAAIAPLRPAGVRPRVSVITPTCDRPAGVALAERWMARQTRQPDEWIVADGGQTPVVCTRGQRHLHAPQPPGPANFAANLRLGVEAATGDVLVFWEDDDWYGPTHLETLLGQLTPGKLAAGDDLQRYYHLPSRAWRAMQNRGASLCQTAFRREAIPLFLAAVEACARARSYGVDGGFWGTVPAAAQALQRTATCVGLKGLPGQAGLGIGHRPALHPGRWQADPGLVQLRRWIGDDVAVYEALSDEATDSGERSDAVLAGVRPAAAR